LQFLGKLHRIEVVIVNLQLYRSVLEMVQSSTKVTTEHEIGSHMQCIKCGVICIDCE